MKKNSVKTVIPALTRADVQAKIVKPPVETTNNLLSVSGYALSRVIFTRLFKYFNIIELSIAIVRTLYTIYKNSPNKTWWMAVKFAFMLFVIIRWLNFIFTSILSLGIWGTLMKLKVILFTFWNESLKVLFYTLWETIDWTKYSPNIGEMIERSSLHEGDKQENLRRFKETNKHLFTKEEFLTPQEIETLEKAKQYAIDSTNDTPWYRSKYFIIGASLVTIGLAYYLYKSSGTLPPINPDSIPPADNIDQPTNNKKFNQTWNKIYDKSFDKSIRSPVFKNNS